MKPNIAKVATTSENIENENLNKLRDIFPNFVQDGQVDFDALQAFLKKDGVLSGTEKYGLNWAGKSNAFKAIRTPSTGTLVPQSKESKDWNTTENIFIEGDNLEVLKLLQKHYREKIKMIYIDPPYNTGQDFVYKDNFTQGVSDYYEQTGQTKDGIKMMANTEKNGRYHSDWLTMMYPRLFLAKNLLKEDGVIFVSIDDHEAADLRLIMDEIFGEENFVGNIAWESKTKSQNTELSYNKLQPKVEHIFVYTKIDGRRFNLISKGAKEYPLTDEQGVYREYPLEVMNATGIRGRRSMIYEIQGILPPAGKQWQLGLDQVATYKSSGNLFVRDGKVIIKMRPEYEKSDLTEPFWAFFSKEIGTAESAKKELTELFGIDNIFDTVKPTDLIKRLIFHATKKDDLILDFFAGSGTTAHAVMDLNAEDNGNRKWICVQLPEVTEEDSEAYKAGYKNIAEIARERIRRASKKIYEDKADIRNPRVKDFDGGFKAYQLSPSNYRQWNTVTNEDDTEEFLKQSKLFLEKPLVDDYKEIDVVYEILLKEGLDLNVPLEGKTVISGGMEYYRAMDPTSLKIIYVTFTKKLSQKMLDEAEIEKDATFVCFDNALDDTTKVNVMRNLNIKTI